MKLLLAALLGIAVFAPATARPAFADTPSPVASPTATPSVLDQTIDVDGVPISIRDLATLIAGLTLVYTPAGPHPSSTLVTKPQSEMPAYDPDWHYVSYTMLNGQPVLTIWTSARLGGKAPFSLIESTGIFGLLDAGFGSAALQTLYVKEKAADAALGPDAANPILNRRKISDQLALMVDNLIRMMHDAKHQRASLGA